MSYRADYGCPLWLKTNIAAHSINVRFTPKSRHRPSGIVMSALCQKRTHALQQKQSVPEIASASTAMMHGKGESAASVDALILVGVSTPL